MGILGRMVDSAYPLGYLGAENVFKQPVEWDRNRGMMKDKPFFSQYNKLSNNCFQNKIMLEKGVV